MTKKQRPKFEFEVDAFDWRTRFITDDKKRLRMTITFREEKPAKDLIKAVCSESIERYFEKIRKND